MAGSVVSLEPKANVRSEASDQLDKAGQAILGLLNRAATAAETNYQQAVEMTHKLSAQSSRNTKIGYEILRQKSAITRTGQTGRRNGCIKFR